MRIRIRTSVRAPFKEVLGNFDENLFVKLSPPFPKVKLIRFDGSTTNDIVSLQLDFMLFKQTWQSKIISHDEGDSRYEFVDVGEELPFFLRKWHHRHIIESENQGTAIVDEITFSTGLLLFDFLMWPAMYLQFWYRKPVYQRYFAN